MTQLLAAMLVLGISAIAAAALVRRRAAALGASAAGCIVAAAIGIPGAIAVLARRSSATLSWSTPLGPEGALTLDPLAAWFLLSILFVSAVCAVYGRRYFLAGGRPLGFLAAGFNLLVLAIVGVVLAADAITFLMAWEIMTLAAFLLVTHEHHRAEVRSAGLLYLVLMHAGTTCLLAFFALLWRSSGSARFAGMALHPALPAASTLALFALAAAGFGCKAGAWPLHVWLPAAHPVAPAHVSALMSGIVIKTGIYGLLRAILLIGPLPVSCGLWLLGAGVASALLGVLSALAQHELKRLLAYHSIENIGIILMGAGVGLLALSTGHPAVAALGFAGALLHVTNHALFKSLLFLAAGAVGKACGTLQLDQLGGLSRRMPRTALSFTIGAAAISGLPPLNGFVSEFLVYLSLLGAIVTLPVAAQSAVVLAFAALACVGGLALACFAKATGAVFLGTPRSSAAALPGEVPFGMQASMGALAASCVLIGLAGPLLIVALDPVVYQLSGVSLRDTAAPRGAELVSVLGAAVIGAACIAWLLVQLLLRGRAVRSGPTWACGYPAVGPSMQYTASSFAQPLIVVFRGILLPVRHEARPDAAFPAVIGIEEHCQDPVERFVLEPGVHGGAIGAALARQTQPKRVQSYVLAIFVAVVALLWWRLG